MAMMQWDESMSVGIVVFDRHHQRLIALINQLDDAMSVGKGKDVLGKILTELISYTDYHFSAEERIFGQYAYPDAQSHVRAHVNLTQKVVDLKIKFDSGRTIISLETMNFLKDWLNNHIMKTDKMYGPFLNSRGVK